MPGSNLNDAKKLLEFVLNYVRMDDIGKQELSSILENKDFDVFVQAIDELLISDVSAWKENPALVIFFKTMLSKANSEENKKILFENIIHIFNKASLHYQGVALNSIVEALSDWLPNTKSIPDNFSSDIVNALINQINKDRFRAKEFAENFIKSFGDFINYEHLKSEIKILLYKMEQSSDNSSISLKVASKLASLRILADKIDPYQLKEIFNRLYKKWNNPQESEIHRMLVLKHWQFFSELQNAFIITQVKESIPELIELTVLNEPVEAFAYKLQEQAIVSLTKHLDLMSESQINTFFENITQIIDAYVFVENNTVNQTDEEQKKGMYKSDRFKAAIEAYLSLLKINNSSIKTTIIDKVLTLLKGKPLVLIYISPNLDKYINYSIDIPQREAIIAALINAADKLKNHCIVKHVHELIERLNIAPDPTTSAKPSPP